VAARATRELTVRLAADGLPVTGARRAALIFSLI
jgi:hypothetical protein